MSDNEDNEDSGLLRTIVEIALEIILIFIIVVLIPYLISGVWPPYVSISSGSMEPNINTGDIVFITDTDRFTTNNSVNGIETDYKYYEQDFNDRGDVIVYYPDGNTDKTPIIHRARYYTEEGENWVRYMDDDYINRNCNEIDNCPSPHDGFITKGDANENYDQSSGLSSPVKSEWIIGKSEFKVPYLGYLNI